MTLSAVIDGVLAALNEVRDMQRLRQAQDPDAVPESGHRAVGYSDSEGKAAMMSAAWQATRDTMVIKEMSVSFSVRIDDAVARNAIANVTGRPLAYDDLEFILDNAFGVRDDRVVVNITFGRQPVCGEEAKPENG